MSSEWRRICELIREQQVHVCDSLRDGQLRKSTCVHHYNLMVGQASRCYPSENCDENVA